MVATLTASKNPVYVKAGTTGTTTISWNIDTELAGRVDLAINGGAAAAFATVPSGVPTGSKAQTVRLGETYVFTLRQSAGNVLLASLTVTVIEQEAAIFGTSVAPPLEYQINPPQRILGLKVEPSVDTVRVSFTTAHPTIPVIEVETLDGTNVGRVIPLLAGLQKAHETIVGWSEPLPQDTRLRLKVTAAGVSALSGRKARDAIRAVEFTTGSRAINVTFDTIHVRKDGDPMSAGDFYLEFAAGDSDGESVFAFGLKKDIDAGDPPLGLGRSVDLPSVKRGVYLQALAADDDTLWSTFR